MGDIWAFYCLAAWVAVENNKIHIEITPTIAGILIVSPSILGRSVKRFSLVVYPLDTNIYLKKKKSRSLSTECRCQ